MRRTSAIPLAVAGALLLAACAPAFADPAVERPAPSSADVPALVEGINDAGLRLYLAARTDGENTALSPVSIGLAFGMADAGATGGVEQAISDFFNFPATGEARLAAFNALDQALESDAEGKVLHIANRMYIDNEFEPREDYRVLLASYFGAGAEPAPLATDGEAAAAQINKWISGKTNGLIKDLVTPAAFSDKSRVMLANTVYMKADWDQPFQAETTVDGAFTRLDGSTTTVPLMHQGQAAGEAAIGDGWVAATKPYLGGASEMLIIVPDAGRFAEVEDALPDVLDDIDGSLVQTPYGLTLPTFTVASKTDLRDVMESSLGVEGLFGVIGLDGIGDELLINSAAHGVRVIVDEEGTEAAAATVIGIDAGSAPIAPDLKVVADHPFIYVIRDTQTGAIEFVGRVLDPSVED